MNGVLKLHVPLQKRLYSLGVLAYINVNGRRRLAAYLIAQMAMS